ncbi:nucleotidyltransferase family protein [Poseidonibacter ostreae]|uniref:Nucleotidyltransferase domain-containing protein n=1 Tax=Poseidonibacter ostreae TaxID=2654171 RepID=A0ABQ6VIT8_9BACT|nr:nucleotidyltransferase domain-containing protein [Poseidonibacter ostreae]KAB7884879.1 nucleotidyltransferase domain-containing protein [Poseidonibacter ostreae]KAB7888942.1 nucleotidyltransferase domain-containing protein [Poseidonibacter ostreae]
MIYDIIIIMNKKEILNKLKELKPIYQNEGLEILGVFGSYAKDTNTKYSDIDIAYKLDYEEFSKRYIGGFSKLIRLDEIKEELQSIFKTEVDFVSDSNKKIMKGLIYV